MGISGARTLIHPIVEAFGLTVLEAAAHGCPAIIPKGSGVSDLFVHGETAFFPQEGDLEEYLQYVEALREAKFAFIMGRKAREISKHYSWEKHV